MFSKENFVKFTSEVILRVDSNEHIAKTLGDRNLYVKTQSASPDKLLCKKPHDKISSLMTI